MANQEALRKWYVALKNGEYPQTTGALKDDNGYCCWGVACDLFKDEVGGSWWQDTPDTETDPPADPAHTFVVAQFGAAGLDVYTGMPPFSVADILGIQLYDRFGPEENVLSSFNDSGKSFDEIADLVWERYGVGPPPEVNSDDS